MSVIFTLSLMINVAIGFGHGLPVPRVHDEFSYLLASDTFASGRLTNPPHPMWKHFETMHVIQQPTYASKYPPGPGLVMAVGQRFLHEPIFAVWLCTALACALICWMLAAWMPVPWAFLGGVLAALHPVVVFWSQNYYGGSLSLLGGALVLGAFRRILDRWRSWDCFLMGAGAMILAITRPYEGFLLVFPLVCALLWKWSRAENRFRRLLILSPLILMFGLTVLLVAVYNRAVTGNPLRMPYMVHEMNYGIAPIFVWQQPRPEPHYNHKAIRDFQVYNLEQIYRPQSHLTGFLRFVCEKLLELGRSYSFAGLMVIPLLLLPWLALGDGWTRFEVGIAVFFLAGLLQVTWLSPHYAAPAAGLLFLLVVQCLRYLSGWKLRNWRPGKWALGAFVLLFCVASARRAESFIRSHDPAWAVRRAQIQAELERSPGEHLILVRYSAHHDFNHEWVYNAAQIDEAKVVWARDMSSKENSEVLAYFRGRKFWLLEADATPPRLTPYETHEQTGG